MTLKNNITGSLTLISFLFIVNCSYGQVFSKSSIKIGFGAGMSSGNNTDGGGFAYTIGYQREIWKERLRLNPNFSIGHYSTKFILDARDQYFNSINIETNLLYDLIKIKPFSLVLGCGGLVNNSRGLKGTGGDPDNNTGTQKSGYINDFHFGVYLGSGFRINPPDKRIAINIMPVNVHFGNNYFAEFHAKIEIDVKL